MQVQDTRPLSELLPQITHALSSCPSTDCGRHVTGLLKQVRPSDISTLLLELDILEIPVDQKLAMIDGLVKSGCGSVGGSPSGEGDPLSVWVSADEGEEVVERLLLHLATGNIPPSRSDTCTKTCMHMHAHTCIQIAKF